MCTKAKFPRENKKKFSQVLVQWNIQDSSSNLLLNVSCCLWQSSFLPVWCNNCVGLLGSKTKPGFSLCPARREQLSQWGSSAGGEWLKLEPGQSVWDRAVGQKCLRVVWESIHGPAQCGASPIYTIFSLLCHLSQASKLLMRLVFSGFVYVNPELSHLRPLRVLWLYWVLNISFLTQSCKFQIFISAAWGCCGWADQKENFCLLNLIFHLHLGKLK